jgi:hypothetical protein
MIDKEKLMGRKKSNQATESDTPTPRAKKPRVAREPKEPRPKKVKEPSEAQLRIAAVGGLCECRGECESAHDGGCCNVPHGKTIVRDEADGSIWQLMSDVDPEKLDGMRPVKVKLGSTLFGDGHGGLVTKIFCQRCRLRVDRQTNARRSASSRKRHNREKFAWAELPGVK